MLKDLVDKGLAKVHLDNMRRPAVPNQPIGSKKPIVIRKQDDGLVVGE